MMNERVAPISPDCHADPPVEQFPGTASTPTFASLRALHGCPASLDCPTFRFGY
jgi:hypothetical protein